MPGLHRNLVERHRTELRNPVVAVAAGQLGRRKPVAVVRLLNHSLEAWREPRQLKQLKR